MELIKFALALLFVIIEFQQDAMTFSSLRPPNSHLQRDDFVTEAVQSNRQANSVVALFKAGDENISPVRKRSESKHLTGAPPTGVSCTSIADSLALNVNEIQEIQMQKKQRIMISSFLALHHEIKELKRQRQNIPAVVSTANEIWDVAVQYFRLVRQNFHPNSRQFQVVRAMMAPDVVYNCEYGFEAIVQSWCFMQWFGNVEVELENLKMCAGNEMIATTRTKVTITERTLANVFPHLLNSKLSNGTTFSSLANKLLGQRLTMRGSTCFRWDGKKNLVVSLVTQSDMLRPLVELLESLDDVSRVFEQAAISPSFQWRLTL
ncbi:hypothetical protein F441_10623 [Phytophthora nicotianae CJ01A1]|uniref:Bzip transcription factor n=1 Tax=Phytophthora nicotianae CJ01A1 TaxID=1317063 RepID=W2WW70_PHYNI|nr:hypothetical protein F441_10623 [Phytophthora nicotianae CJ01A1]